MSIFVLEELRRKLACSMRARAELARLSTAWIAVSRAVGPHPILNIGQRQVKIGCNGFGKGLCCKPVPHSCKTQSSLWGPLMSHANVVFDMLQIGILISSTGGLNANLKKLILSKSASKREPKDSPLSNYVSISNLDGPVEQEDRLTRMIERFRQVVLKSK